MRVRRESIAKPSCVIVFLAACSLLHVQCTSRHEGIVVSATTGEPVPGAFVDIWSAGPFDDVETNCSVVSDERGRFVANVTWKVLGARAWKPGFALNGNHPISGEGCSMENPLEICLRPLTNSRLVPSQTTECSSCVRVGEGMVLATGTIVEAEDSTADFVISSEPGHPTRLFIMARGAGGVVPQAADTDDWLEFRWHNTPEAPETGYVDRCELQLASAGAYETFYIRTRDGQHYGKLQFTPEGILFAYQTDGTRDHELAIDQDFPFPLERFGIDRQALHERGVAHHRKDPPTQPLPQGGRSN